MSFYTYLVFLFVEILFTKGEIDKNNFIKSADVH